MIFRLSLLVGCVCERSVHGSSCMHFARRKWNEHNRFENCWSLTFFFDPRPGPMKFHRLRRWIVPRDLWEVHAIFNLYIIYVSVSHPYMVYFWVYSIHVVNSVLKTNILVLKALHSVHCKPVDLEMAGSEIHWFPTKNHKVTHTIHVWYIYLHVVDFLWVFM